MSSPWISFEAIPISPGVEEVYAGDLQVGMITFNPDQMTTRWYATYANADTTVPCANRDEAMTTLQVQHEVARRLARSIRSIRPAANANADSAPTQAGWDRGYNEALRDVERLVREVVGQAAAGEGYTAITRP